MAKALLSLSAHRRLDHSSLYEHYMTVMVYGPDEFCEVASGVMEMPVSDKDVELLGVDGWVSVSGDGGTMEVGLEEKGGGEILSPRLTFQSGSEEDDKTADFTKTLLPANTILRLSIFSVHSTLPAKGLTVRLKLKVA